MLVPNPPRSRPTLIGFSLALVLLPIRSVLVPLGIGILIFAVGMALLLPDA